MKHLKTSALVAVLAMVGAPQLYGTIKAHRVDKETKPVIDGKLTDPCWKEAEATAEFWKLDGSAPVTSSATARMAYDNDTLYVAFRCPPSNGASAQVFLDPFLDHQREVGLGNDLQDAFYNHPGPKIFRFSVNAANERSSDLLGLSWWQVPWVSATHSGADSWTAELAIPLASLAYTEPQKGGNKEGWGTSWGANFVYDDTAWIPNFEVGNKAIRSRKFSPEGYDSGYPIRYGMVSDLLADSAPYRWGYLMGVGPRVVGEVEIALTLNNYSNRPRKVKVMASVITHDGKKVGAAFQPVQGVGFTYQRGFRHVKDHWESSNEGITWDHGYLKVPLSEPGRYTVLLSIVDMDSGKELSHRPVLIDSVEVALPVWDRSFYMNEPTATVTLQTNRLDGTAYTFPETRLDLRQKGKVDVLQSHRGSVGDNGTARATFDIASLPVGDYTVTITLTGYEESPVETTFRKLAPRPGAVQYTDYGVLLRDGKPFFPMGFFYIKNYLHGTNEKGEPDEEKTKFRDEYVEAGFTSFMMEWVHSEAYVQISRNSKPFGLVPIVGVQKMGEALPYDSKGDYTWKGLLEGRIPSVRQGVQMVSRLAGDNILCWFLRDEPNEIMYPMVKGYHDLIKEEDPYHPTLTSFATENLYAMYYDATDIQAPFEYPSPPDGRIAGMGEIVGKAARDIRGKPVFAIPQAFIPVNTTDIRMPTRAEARCMAYHSIVNGAAGLIYFSYHHCGPMKIAKPASWKIMKELAGEIKQLTPIILSKPPSSTSLTTEGRKGIVARLFEHDGRYYVIAVNHEDRQEKSVKFTLQRSSGRKLKIKTLQRMFEDGQVTVRDNEWIDDFDNYETHVYKIED